MRRLLGVEVPDDAHGCLQDVHWSGGMFGYFPSYALGNLAAAQLTAKLSETVNLDAAVGVGDFSRVRSWLRDNVHIQTDVVSLDDLMVRATGTSLDPAYFQRYLEAKD
jgi:carboxypeptidase Taq